MHFGVLNILILVFLVRRINGQFTTNKVVADVTKEVKLSCEQGTSMRWFKAPNIQLNDISADTIYDKSFYRIDTTTTGSSLVLLKPNRTDIGNGIYYGALLPDLKKAALLMFYFFTNPTGYFTSTNILDPQNSPAVDINVNTQIDVVSVDWDVVFPFNFNYLYKVETLPLNQLTINDSVIPATDCKTNFTTLNCLFANYTRLFPKCTNSTDIIIGYKYDNPELYKENILNKYTLHINFDYPPQFVSDRVTQYVNNINENVTLNCETYPECGIVTAYSWRRNKFVISNATTKTINIFPNLTSTTDSVTFTCIVQGGKTILTSSATFIVSVKTGLEAWQIALIVVGSVLGVALIIVLIVIIWKFCLKSSTSATISS